MAGRFRLYADANIHGPVIEGLVRRGWDLVRAVDAYPEGTDDDIHFERAATEGRVLVSNDMDMKNLAEKWFEERRHFTGLIWWPKEHHRHMRVGDLLAAFEELAARDDPWKAGNGSLTRTPVALIRRVEVEGGDSFRRGQAG